MNNLKKQYRDLEQSVLRQLRDKIEKSKYISKHISKVAIKVNIFDYTELTIVNDSLTFIDNNGMHYSVFTNTNLEDLIDVLNTK